MKRQNMLWGMTAVLLIATVLRMAAFGEAPPGLYHDEAYNGLDALEVLDGRISLYFPANNGREPLFIHLVGLTVGLLGRSPFALRLPSLFAGLLTIAATAAMGRTLFSRRVGLLAAAVLAVIFWHVHLSRVGFRAVLLPLFIALSVWQGALGNKTGLRRHWLAAGVFYGTSFYTYTASRFTPVALAACGLYALAVRFPIRNRARDGIGSAALAALATIAPLATYTVGHIDIVLGRSGQVSFLNPAISGGDPWGALVAHTLRTLEMFFLQGDRIWRHNIPRRPIFDPMLGGAFLLGAAVALRRARRDIASGFILIWTAVMSLPTILAEDAPHFLRAVGVLPAVTFFPALGLDFLQAQIKMAHTRSKLKIPTAIPILFLLFALGSTSWACWYDYRDPAAGYWFEEGAETLAGRINDFLGLGWDGKRMLHGDPGNRRVYLAPRLWDDWRPQMRFLITASDAVMVGKEKGSASGPAAAFTWPYGDWRWAWSLLPTQAEISVEKGPLSQGDNQPQPYTTYLAFFADASTPNIPAQAHFSSGVELLDVEVSPMEKERLKVQFRWRATTPLDEDYTIFLHYLRDGERIAQGDFQPAAGYYPTTAWRPGDVIIDDHYIDDIGLPIPERDELRFGFWQPESSAKLYLLDEAGNQAGDWIKLPIEPLISNLQFSTGGP